MLAVLDVGGDVVHKQGEADKDATIGERLASATGQIERQTVYYQCIQDTTEAMTYLSASCLIMMHLDRGCTHCCHSVHLAQKILLF